MLSINIVRRARKVLFNPALRKHFSDETVAAAMRYGTRTHARRRWTRPVCKVKIGYDWGYLYTAICPYTGDVFACLLSHLDKSCFDVFLEQFKSHLREKNIETKQVLLIGDGATAHQKTLVEKQGMQWVKLPTACPE